MKYQKIETCDVANGIGLGIVFWCQGCDVHCPGCHNPSTWNYDDGYVFTDKAKNQIYSELQNPWITRITFSGGHPLDPANKPEVIELIRDIRTRFPTKSIWLYTGYVWESFKSEEWVKDVDVIVDGPFILAQRDITLPYRGSKNQRIIDVKKSLQTNQIVLLDVK